LLRVDQRGGSLAAAGLFSHRNTIGAFLEVGPALVVYLMARGSRALVRAYWVALALIGTHLMLTFSRSSQIVALISLTPLLIPARRRVRIAVAVVAGAIAVVALVVAVVPEFRAYAALGASLTRRQDIWRFMLQQAPEHPWFGVGLQNINYLAHGVRYGPHNLYLAQLVYFGAVGLALFIVLLATLGRAIASTIRLERDWRPRLIVMLLAGVLLQGGVEYMVTAPVFFLNSIFWICAGFASRPRGAGAYSIP
jgi:O-antigen ligase